MMRVELGIAGVDHCQRSEFAGDRLGAAGPPEGASAKMVLDELIDKLVRLRVEKDPKRKPALAKELGPVRDARVTVALMEIVLKAQRADPLLIDAAGPLLRRGGPLWKVVPPYLETALPVAGLMVPLFALLAIPLLRARFGTPFWHFALLLALPALALVGAQRRWHWVLRVLLHAAWVGALFAS